MTSLRYQVAVVMMLIVALGWTEAQNSCTNELSNLNVCAPFVVPGAANTNPSPECCGALEAVNHDCLCNMLRIASQLPSQCQLPSLPCGAN